MFMSFGTSGLEQTLSGKKWMKNREIIAQDSSSRDFKGLGKTFSYNGISSGILFLLYHNNLPTTTILYLLKVTS